MIPVSHENSSACGFIFFAQVANNPGSCEEWYLGDERDGVRHGHGAAFFTSGDVYLGEVGKGCMFLTVPGRRQSAAVVGGGDAFFSFRFASRVAFFLLVGLVFARLPLSLPQFVPGFFLACLNGGKVEQRWDAMLFV